MNSYLYACFFIKNAKSKQKVIEIINLYKEALDKKYHLFETTDDFGFKIYGGGVSPLWDGSWFDYVSNMSDDKYSTAIHTDVIEYDDDLVRYGYKYKYGVRIVYDPFEYVKEEF